jgi:hypothetical protein
VSAESIKQRLAAAEPGPWEVMPGTLYGGGYTVGRRGVAVDDWGTEEYHVKHVLVDNAEEAELIAHAPTDLALLLTVAEAASFVADLLDVWGCAPEATEGLDKLNAALDAMEAAP